MDPAIFANGRQIFDPDMPLLPGAKRRVSGAPAFEQNEYP
jgi:hypothetical protein